MGIFLAHSPNHASSVPLVLNTSTGLVSPQFHCTYDDDFDTCKRDAKFESLWQRKAKLDRQNVVQRMTVSNTNPLQEPAPSLPNNQPSIPHFVTPWDSNTTVGDLTDLTVDFDHSTDQAPSVAESPDMESESVNANVPEPMQAARVTRSGRQVRPNPRYFDDARILSMS